MRRVGEEVPVLPVPLVATALLQAEAPLTRAQLEAAVNDLMADLPNAHVHIPRDDQSYAVEVGLRNLRRRRIALETDGQFAVSPEDAPIMAFYAASISHLFRTRGENA